MEYRERAINDPKYHEYWSIAGCPTDDEDCLEQFYNPPPPSRIYHLFITIALPNLPLDFIDKREKVLEYLGNLRKVSDLKYLQNNTGIGTMEFFSLEPKLKMLKENPHIHILYKGKLAKFDKARVIRDFSRAFKVKDNFIDVKYTDIPELYTTREEYIKGIKRKEKCLATERDIVERKELEIENYFLYNIHNAR